MHLVELGLLIRDVAVTSPASVQIKIANFVAYCYNQAGFWRGVRVADGAGFENRCAP